MSYVIPGMAQWGEDEASNVKLVKVSFCNVLNPFLEHKVFRCIPRKLKLDWWKRKF